MSSSLEEKREYMRKYSSYTRRISPSYSYHILNLIYKSHSNSNKNNDNNCRSCLALKKNGLMDVFISLILTKYVI